MRLFFLILFAMVIGAALGHFGPVFVRVADQTEFEFPAPDPDPKYVKPPRPGQSYGCNPLARGNVFLNRLTRKATIWASQSASNVAVRIGDDGKRLLLMVATDVSFGTTEPQEFKITMNMGDDYIMAEQQLTFGIALISFDAKTMRMVWSYNGEGMLGMKGESVLYQCR